MLARIDSLVPRVPYKKENVDCRLHSPNELLPFVHRLGTYPIPWQYYNPLVQSVL